MSEVEQLVLHMQETRKKYLNWRNSLDLDAKQNSRIANRRSQLIPRTIEQLRSIAKTKKRWRGACSQSVQFSKPGVLPPRILSPWQMAKAMAPDRSLKAPKGVKSMKIDSIGKIFPEPNLDLLTSKYRKVVQRIMQEHKNYVQHPSRFKKSQFVPTILHPRGFRPSGSSMGEFNFTTTHMLPRSMIS